MAQMAHAEVPAQAFFSFPKLESDISQKCMERAGPTEGGDSDWSLRLGQSEVDSDLSNTDRRAFGAKSGRASS
jgi:hypothetical protein